MLAEIADKIRRGKRLHADDGLRLYETDELLHLGKLAEKATFSRQGRNVYYSINRHINYTNICAMRCGFCGFSRRPGQPGGYVMEVEEVIALAQQACRQGATEVHIVGGIHPDLNLDYYEGIIECIRQRCPQLHIKAFTAVEIVALAAKAGRSIEETLGRLKQKGLGSLPGGGAEILSEEYFHKYCPSKPGPQKWLEVHATAHRLGIPTNATMLYGYKESYAERIEHLLRLRALQDESLARGKGHFQCFVPLPYINPKSEILNSKQFQMTKIQNSKQEKAQMGQPEHNCTTKIDILDDLKTVAISRLMLDNIAHLKAFWPMLGVNVSQIALGYGADDLDGTVRQYRIVEHGQDNAADNLSVEKIKAMVAETGRIPVQRDAYYRAI